MGINEKSFKSIDMNWGIHEKSMKKHENQWKSMNIEDLGTIDLQVIKQINCQIKQFVFHFTIRPEGFTGRKPKPCLPVTLTAGKATNKKIFFLPLTVTCFFRNIA